MQRLLSFLEDQTTDFRPAVRWLMLGRTMAESLMSDFVREPDLDQLLGLMRLIKNEEPELIDTVTLLAASSPHAEQLRIEVQLDFLVDRDPGAWNHPVQILLRPRSPYGVLLTACRGRLERSDADSAERLRSVESKLRRAVELEERARRRRQQRRAAQLMKETKDDEGVN